ncbi:MAG: hypothetical protein HY722_16555 [Planctomycetes bacterium]|nr:hypothetical protein [Planctomycetota bacterium]
MQRARERTGTRPCRGPAIACLVGFLAVLPLPEAAAAPVGRVGTRHPAAYTALGRLPDTPLPMTLPGLGGVLWLDPRPALGGGPWRLLAEPPLPDPASPPGPPAGAGRATPSLPWVLRAVEAARSCGNLHLWR